MAPECVLGMTSESPQNYLQSTQKLLSSMLMMVMIVVAVIPGQRVTMVLAVLTVPS